MGVRYPFSFWHLRPKGQHYLRYYGLYRLGAKHERVCVRHLLGEPDEEPVLE